jgi:hypothetical protein
MEYIIGLIVILLGSLFYEKSKRKSAEGVLENLETKKEIIEVEKDVSKNDGLIEAEKEKREEIKNDKTKKSLSDLARFFNGSK